MFEFFNSLLIWFIATWDVIVLFFGIIWYVTKTIAIFIFYILLPLSIIVSFIDDVTDEVKSIAILILFIIALCYMIFPENFITIYIYLSWIYIFIYLWTEYTKYTTNKG